MAILGYLFYLFLFSIEILIPNNFSIRVSHGVIIFLLDDVLRQMISFDYNHLGIDNFHSCIV